MSSRTLDRAVCPLRMGATAGCATEMAADVGWGLPEMVRAKAFLPAGNENAGKDRSWKFIDLKFLKVLAGVVGGSWATGGRPRSQRSICVCMDSETIAALLTHESLWCKELELTSDTREIMSVLGWKMFCSSQLCADPDMWATGRNMTKQ